MIWIAQILHLKSVKVMNIDYFKLSMNYFKYPLDATSVIGSSKM